MGCAGDHSRRREGDRQSEQVVRGTVTSRQLCRLRGVDPAVGNRSREHVDRALAAIAVHGVNGRADDDRRVRRCQRRVTIERELVICGAIAGDQLGGLRGVDVAPRGRLREHVQRALVGVPMDGVLGRGGHDCHVRRRHRNAELVIRGAVGGGQLSGLRGVDPATGGGFGEHVHSALSSTAADRVAGSTSDNRRSRRRHGHRASEPVTGRAVARGQLSGLRGVDPASTSGPGEHIHRPLVRVAHLVSHGDRRSRDRHHHRDSLDRGRIVGGGQLSVLHHRIDTNRKASATHVDVDQDRGPPQGQPGGQRASARIAGHQAAVTQRAPAHAPEEDGLPTPSHRGANAPRVGHRQRQRAHRERVPWAPNDETLLEAKRAVRVPLLHPATDIHHAVLAHAGPHDGDRAP